MPRRCGKNLDHLLYHQLKRVEIFFFILMAMKTVEDPVWMYALGYIQYGCMDVDRSMDRCNLHPYGLLY